MIYRVHYNSGIDGSQGYEYFSSIKEAVKAVEKYNDDPEYVGHFRDAYIVKIPTPKTKKEMIRVLNTFGSHANNG